MAYIVVEDFKYGMDRRRKRVAGTPGTLWEAKNVHVTRGGDIERRKKFVPQYHVPGTFGAARLRSQVFVFGSADLAASMPVDVQYQRLDAGGAAMEAVLDVKSAAGKLYVVAEYTDGAVYHFYDGVRLADWDVIAASAAGHDTVATTLARKIQANAAVDVRVAGPSMTITARNPGTPFTLSAIVAGSSVAAQQTLQINVSGPEPVAQVEKVTFLGAFAPSDVFSVFLDGYDYRTKGLASATGRSVYVDKQRVWSVSGSVWWYSMLKRPDVWDPARSPAVTDNDAGFINIASESEGNEDLVVAARYQQDTALFSGSSILTYTLDTDPANFRIGNVLENIGTTAPGSVIRYGNNDVFYLDQTGVRSLRARDASNAPFVSDIGNPIDTYIQDFVDSISIGASSSAIAAIEPRDGRYWLAIGERVFVLSYFPGAKVTAWSYYDTSEFGAPVQAMFPIGKTLMIRAGDYVYAYGGLFGDALPEDGEVEALVEMPFLSARTPATIKQLIGFDLAAENTWECEVALDPNAEAVTENIGRIAKISMSDTGRITLPGMTSMVAPIFRCAKGGAATISMFALHYEGDAAA